MNNFVSVDGLMLKEIKISGLLLLVMVTITGVIYPLIINNVAKVAFPEKAAGSLMENDGKIIGSSLIGQQFTKSEYFHPRPSSVEYNAMASGGSNLSQGDPKLHENIEARLKAFSDANSGKKVPEDLLMASGSGLDPHISVEAAMFQVARVAKARKIDSVEVESLVNSYIEWRFLGIFGAPRVNVLFLNLALDRKK